MEDKQIHCPLLILQEHRIEHPIAKKHRQNHPCFCVLRGKTFFEYQVSRIQHRESSIHFRTTRDTRRATKNQPNVQGGKSKNPFFQIFFISFHTNAYKFNHYEKYTNFQSNAQAEAIAEVPSGVEGSSQ